MIAIIEPPVAPPTDTSYGVISTEISSIKSILIGFFIVANPLSFRPNGSLKLIPSIEKSLNLALFPITEISASLLFSPSKETRGSNFT